MHRIEQINLRPRKTFIVGLPRTGTSSLCYLLLNAGLKVAHTAFTKEAIEQADVIADTPVFTDYRELAQLYPHSLFIYLERDLKQWLPSIQKLLNKISTQQKQANNKLHPLIQQCFEQQFGPLSHPELLEEKHLTNCYLHHKEQCLKFMTTTQQTFITINLESGAGLDQLKIIFNNLDANLKPEKLNHNGKINDWKKIKHPLKISSHLANQNGRRDFFNYRTF